MPPAAIPSSPMPPLPPPASPPYGPQLRQVVDKAKRFLHAWTPRDEDKLGERFCCAAITVLLHVKKEMVTEIGAMEKAVQALWKFARDIRRTSRCIGLLAFIVYAHRRRVRARVLLGTRSVHLLETFALALAGG